MSKQIKVKSKIYNKISGTYGVIVSSETSRGRKTYTVKWDRNDFLSDGYTKGELMDDCYKILAESKLPKWF
jgi:hypothetical protein